MYSENMAGGRLDRVDTKIRYLREFLHTIGKVDPGYTKVHERKAKEAVNLFTYMLLRTDFSSGVVSYSGISTVPSFSVPTTATLRASSARRTSSIGCRRSSPTWRSAASASGQNPGTPERGGRQKRPKGQ